jgi:hypothetical protein
MPDLLANGRYGESLQGALDELTEKWPFAVISSPSSNRRRVYSWANIAIDDECYSDLPSVQRLLIATFYTLNRRYVEDRLYEQIWRPSFFVSDAENVAFAHAQVGEKGRRDGGSVNSAQDVDFTSLDQALAKRFGRSFSGLSVQRRTSSSSFGSVSSSSRSSNDGVGAGSRSMMLGAKSKDSLFAPTSVREIETMEFKSN